MSALAGSTFTETFGHLYDPKDLAMFLEEKHAPALYREIIGDDRFGVWLAKSAEDGLIGYVVAGPCDLPVPDMPDKSGELMRFYIDETFRGAGLGGRMFEGALDWLEAQFDHIYLSVYAENFGAQRFYKRFGFEKVHEYFFMVGTKADPEFILKKR